VTITEKSTARRNPRPLDAVVSLLAEIETEAEAQYKSAKCKFASWPAKRAAEAKWDVVLRVRKAIGEQANEKS
jgi:hypothetical protein